MIQETQTSSYIYDNEGKVQEYICHEKTLDDKIMEDAYERDKQINPHLYDKNGDYIGD